jgi:hypothetical protein
MTALVQLQDAFLACLHDDDAPLPPGWDASRAAGMAVYRNAYRARLLDVLGESYERTARLVGPQAFHQAAAHHLIAHPPSSWTIDRSGEGFAESCAALFAHDADVAELAWLEWAMQRTFTAANDAHLTIVPIAGTALRPVTHDLARLWQSLSDAAGDAVVEPLEQRQWVLVWREGEEAVFVLLSDQEGAALDVLLRGAAFGDLCAALAEQMAPEAAASAAGIMLHHWLELGLIRAVAAG